MVPSRSRVNVFFLLGGRRPGAFRAGARSPALGPWARARPQPEGPRAGARARARPPFLRRRTAAPLGPGLGSAGAGLWEGAGRGGAPRPGRGPGGESTPHRLSWERRRRQALTSAGGALPTLRHPAGAQSPGGWRLAWRCGRLALSALRTVPASAPAGPWAGLRPLLREYPAGLLVAGARARSLGLPWPPSGTVAWRAARVLRRGGGGPGRPGGGCPAPLQSDPPSAAEWRDGVSESYLFVLNFLSPIPGLLFTGTLSVVSWKSEYNLCLSYSRFWFNSV